MFLDAGISVSGSDVRQSAATDALVERGVRVGIGHDAQLIVGADALVVTGALWQDNPEYQEALRRNLPVLHRSHALAWLTRNRRVIAVAGAHGKTTSTGMIVTALLHAGRQPSFVNGGVIAALNTSAQWGSDRDFVIEADESDGSFLMYDTAVALITNVDPDHLDHYGSREAFDDAFVSFASSASEAVVISADDPGAVAVSARLKHPNVITFGTDATADVRLHDIDTSGGRVQAKLTFDGITTPLQLQVAGAHNALNAAGVFAVLIQLGLSAQQAAAGLAEFGGTIRRFELHGERRDVRVYDDYAHHPTEVASALSAARTAVGTGRIIAIHQPHLYTRTRDFAAEFASVLEQHAEHTIVLDVYGAREDPIPGVTGETVSSLFADTDRVSYLPDWQQAARRAAEIARQGDFIITLGCGDVYRIIPSVLEALEQ